MSRRRQARAAGRKTCLSKPVYLEAGIVLRRAAVPSTSAAPSAVHTGGDLHSDSGALDDGPYSAPVAAHIGRACQNVGLALRDWAYKTVPCRQRARPAIRTLISVPAGSRKMPLLRFLGFSIAASVLWTGGLTADGCRLPAGSKLRGGREIFRPGVERHRRLFRRRLRVTHRT